MKTEISVLKSTGGLVATRGFYYQYVYTLRLMSLLVNKSYTHFMCEQAGDFALWNQKNGIFKELVIVEVKTRTSSCFLNDKAGVSEVLRRFTRILRQLPPGVTVKTRLKFLLVVNPIVKECNDHLCALPLEGLEALQQLKNALRAAGHEVDAGTVQYEHFLPIPYTLDALHNELQFLGSEVCLALSSLKDVKALVQGIVGLVLPLYAPRRPLRPDEPGSLVFDDLLFDRARVINDLQTAIGAVVGRANVRKQLVDSNPAVNYAKALAKAIIETNSGRAPDDSISLNVGRMSTAVQRLSFALLLDDTSHPSAWPRESTVAKRMATGVQLFASRGNLIPLGTYLSEVGTTHRVRIQLIVSLARALVEWSRKGVALRHFRSTDPRYSELYFVDQSENPDSPRFVLGDLGALEISSQRGAFLDARWVRGDIFAQAARSIYYGSYKRRQLEASRIYQRPWNDNIVNNFASWIEERVLDASDLVSEILELFDSELTRVPVFVSNNKAEFLDDLIDGGCRSIIEGFGRCRPRAFVGDGVSSKKIVMFASGYTHQVSLSPIADGTLRAERFVRYFTRRWDEARQRDEALSVPLTPDRREGTLVWVAPKDLEAVSKEVFGMQPGCYRQWLNGHLTSVTVKAQQFKPPGVLAKEVILHRNQCGRLKYLDQGRFSFTLSPDLCFSQSRIVLVAEGRELIGLLNSCGYDSRCYTDLIAKGIDEDGNAFRAAITKVDILKGTARLHLAIEGYNHFLPETSGIIRLYDDGLDRILKDDDVPLGDLRAGRKPGIAPFAHDALAYVQKIVGSEELPLRTNLGLWAGTARLLKVAASDESVAQLSSRIVAALREPGQQWWGITGAAGTGKTTVTASVVSKYLDTTLSSCVFPPPRVLVVAATHFALENFLGVFDGVTCGRHVPYHYVSATRLERLLAGGRIDHETYAQRENFYETVTQPVRARLSQTPARDSVDSVRQHLEDAQAALGGRATDFNKCALIPSHDQWRLRRLRTSSWTTSAELSSLKTLIANRLTALLQYTSTNVSSKSVGPAAHRDPYSCFAAPVVVVTSDALRDLPDVSFDLVVFEEASQLRALKLLKVLNKVARSRLDGEIPAVLFSGDARQLPPFIDTSDYPAGPTTGTEPIAPWFADLRERRDLVARESIFEAALQIQSPSRITVLSTQRRMHRGVATLVNSLFYSDQTWTLEPDVTSGSVVWIDTSAGHSFVESDGPSRYNKFEMGIIGRIVQQLDDGSIRTLVVSPYAAQVRRLKQLVSGTVKVSTIDGCQGYTADTVIVSFVSLAFMPGADFVAEPRRMNVAISRARHQLYLVGNLTELRASVGRYGNKYPHMAGLAKLAEDPTIITVVAANSA